MRRSRRNSPGQFYPIEDSRSTQAGGALHSGMGFEEATTLLVRLGVEPKHVRKASDVVMDKIRRGGFDVNATIRAMPRETALHELCDTGWIPPQIYRQVLR